MRITENTHIASFLENLNGLQNRRSKLMEKLSSGKDIARPSDDPDGVAKLIDIAKELEQFERYQKNINDSKTWLNMTEASLNGIIDQLTKATTVAGRASNDTVDEDTRKNYADQIQQILETVVSEANKKYNDYYVFGGTVSKSPPFKLGNEVSEEQFTAQAGEQVRLDYTDLAEDAVVLTSADGSVTLHENVDFTLDREKGIITGLAAGDYVISYKTNNPSVVEYTQDSTTGKVFRDIMSQQKIQINLSGEEIFVQGQDVFQTLTDLKNALIRNDAEKIRAVNPGLKKAIDQVIRYTAIAGLKYEHITMVEKDLEKFQLQYVKLQSQIEDADMAELIVKFENNETVYNAFLKAGAKLIKPSLIDYIQ